MVWHPALLSDYEEEALMKLGNPSEISEIQQVIRRILAELERLFHNLHCHFEDNGYAGLSELRSPNFRS